MVGADGTGGVVVGDGSLVRATTEVLGAVATLGDLPDEAEVATP